MSYRLSEDIALTMLETTDIGGTSASTAWVSMENYERVYAYVEIGTWDATDDLDRCQIEQAQDSGGTGAKDLTTYGSGSNYDTDSPVDADGDFVVVEARAEDLDTDNGFTHVRLTVAEDGNTGPDNVTAVLVRHGSTHRRKELQGAATAGSQVYVTPQS